MHLKRPSPLEQITGSLTTEVALTAIGAAVGGVLAPLLPILAKSLAAERQRERVEKALAEISLELAAQEDRIRNLSDAQYKIVNEMVLIALQTTEPNKLTYLKFAVRNAIAEDQYASDEAAILTRIIRDISVPEVLFLLNAFKYKGVALTNFPMPDLELEDNVLHVPPDSFEALRTAGLVSMGILQPGDPTYDITPLRFTRIAAKLIALVRATDA